ncbi:MAG: hypothetical protein E7641_01720 [Ruminococcaceae bacterium]|nr:hypothetical protein [Oscillospiraceae bacterium]
MKSKGRYLRILTLLLVVAVLFCSCKKGDGNIPESNDEEGLVPVIATLATGETTNGGGSEKKRVALTLDDGPHNVYTKKIVDELSKYQYHATFFVLGNRVDGTSYSGGSAMIYAAEAGNEIAIHGYTHKLYFDKCSDEEYKSELSRTEKAIKDKYPAVSVRLMRPVGGRITNERVTESEYSIIMWSVDSEDWKYKYKSGDTDAAKKEKVDAIVNNVMNGVSDGSIILMHDIYESTYDAVVVLLEKLHSEGYEVVTVSELLGSDLHAGARYYREG